MNRWGTSMTFRYASGDSLVSPHEIVLPRDSMPQYPVETYEVTDKTSYRSKNGQSWQYQNYQKLGYVFRWSLLNEADRALLKIMHDNLPILSIESNGQTLGTFRIAGDGWADEEVLHQLYDLEMHFEEA